MASPQDSGGGEGVTERERRYRKEYSLYVNVGDNQSVKPKDIIEAVNKLVGKGKLYACVRKSGNMYLLTFEDQTVANLVSDGVQCGEKHFECKSVKSNNMNVSFMNVDPYVPDGEIISKMEEMNLTVIGDVRRVCYKDTEVENGNRVCRIKLPPNFVSLPYLMKLSDGEASGMYRVIHDNQRKLCHNCHKEGHLFRECPEFLCYKCSKQGHFKRQCTAVWCQQCFKYDCERNHEDEDEEESIDDDCGVGGSDSEPCAECGRDWCICKDDDDDGDKDSTELKTENRKEDETAVTETVFGDFLTLDNDKTLNHIPPVDDPHMNVVQPDTFVPEQITRAEPAHAPADKGSSHHSEDTKSTESPVTTIKNTGPNIREEENMITDPTTNKRANTSPAPTNRNNKVKVVDKVKGVDNTKRKKKNK